MGIELHYIPQHLNDRLLRCRLEIGEQPFPNRAVWSGDAGPVSLAGAVIVRLEPGEVGFRLGRRDLLSIADRVYRVVEGSVETADGREFMPTLALAR